MVWGYETEHSDLRAVTRGFLERYCDESEVRRVMGTVAGHDAQLWRRMADDTGVQSMLVPEPFGGAGYSYRELGVFLEESGRALLCAPLLSTALATAALVECGDEAVQHDYLPGIAKAEIVATVSLTDRFGAFDAASVATSATRSGGAWVLDGAVSLVLDGHVADLLLIPARTDAGVSLFAVAGTAEGVHRTPLAGIDETRKLSHISLARTPARLVGVDGEGSGYLRRLLQIGGILLAAEQVGGAQRCLEMAAEYARTRVQFGRTIGSFQAIKHLCADLMLEVEAARAVAYRALAAAADRAPELTVLAHLASITSSEAFTHVAGENIHIHGGIGFTWEHPAHLYFKRAKVSEALFGNPDWHRRVLGDAAGIVAATSLENTSTPGAHRD